MRLDRPDRPLPVVSIVPLIDVLLILLVFFMVTSTFLDLDMYPLSPKDQGEVTTQTAANTRTVLMRILPSGDVIVAGNQIATGDILGFLNTQADQYPEARLLILPSAQAKVQSLVTLLDQAADAGFSNVQIVRFGAGK